MTGFDVNDADEVYLMTINQMTVPALEESQSVTMVAPAGRDEVTGFDSMIGSDDDDGGDDTDGDGGPSSADIAGRGSGDEA